MMSRVTTQVRLVRAAAAAAAALCLCLLAQTQPQAASGPLPEAWATRDIGHVGVTGRASYGSGAFLVQGAGTDIWNSADGFRFAYRQLTGDGAITARVASLSGVEAWSKAGVMMRDTLQPGSRHAFMLVSTSRGLAFQRRPTANGTSVHTAGSNSTAPAWVRLVRQGQTITAFSSTNGVSWTQVGSQSISMGQTIYVGLAVSSQNTSRTASATFEHVAVTAGGATASATGALPSGWNTRDVGTNGGSAAFGNSTFVLEATGGDIWSTSDRFRYAYRTLSGDGDIVARVTSVQIAHHWSKAGVMMRATLDPGSPHATMLVSAEQGLAFQRRPSGNALSVHTTGGSGTAPNWVKLERRGNTFRSYRSANGSSWTLVDTHTISMPGTIFVGIAVSSHDPSLRASGTFDQVSLTGQVGGTTSVGGSGSSSSSGDSSSSGSSSDSSTTITGSLPSSWSTRDIGTSGGRAASDGTTFLLEGTGGDIWSSSDRFRYVHRSLSGDGDLVARVSSLHGLHHWAKAGVMMRETLNANSKHAFMLVSADRGYAFQRRASTGGSSTSTDGGSGKAPGWVKLERRGNSFRAYKSSNGTSWTLIGSQTISMASTIQVGLAVSSHEGQTATATFDHVSLTPVASGGGSSSGGSRELRVLHWNIQHGRLDNNQYNPPKQADWMASFSPDIISLNEVHYFTSGHGNEDQARRYAELMEARTGSKWYYYQRVANGNSRGQGNAILSRFPIEATSHCQLSSDRNAVNVTVTAFGRRVNVWSTHLSVNWAGSGLTDSQAQALRTEEIKNLLACARNFPEQRILAGDFNTQSTSSELRLVTETYIDVWPAAKALGTAANYPGNCDGCTRRSRIDYIFHSKQAGHLVLRGAEVFDTRDSNGIMASDHKPLMAIYDVK